MNQALLVIDMQNICVGENHATIFKYDNSTLIKNVNTVISRYNSDNVYYILNIMKNNWISKLAPFKAYEGSYEVELVNDLSVVNNKKFKKYKGDAFSNKNLIQVLRNANVTEIEIVGVDGGGCVARTALGALKEGFHVTLNTNAIGTIFEKKADKLNKKLKSHDVIFK